MALQDSDRRGPIPTPPETMVSNSSEAPLPVSHDETLEDTIDPTNDAENDNENNGDLENDSELMKLVAEAGKGDVIEDSPGPEAPKGAAQTPPFTKGQQSLTMADDATAETNDDNVSVAMSQISMPPPPTPALNLGSSILRTPSTDINPDLVHIRQAQQVMRAKMLAAKQQREAASKWGTSSGPASRESSDGFGLVYNAPADDSDGPDENEEQEHKRLANEWKKKKASFERRRKQGVTGVDEELEFARDQHQEDIRVRQYNECKQRVEEEQRRSRLPPPASNAGTAEAEGLFVSSDEEMDDEEEDDLHRSVSKKSNGKRKAGAKNRPDLADDNEGFAALLEDLHPKKRPKKSKGSEAASSVGAATSSTGAAKGRPRGKKDSGSRQKGSKQKKGSKSKTYQQADVGSLFTANVIKDAGRNHELGDQPTFTSTRRSEAFRELIATLPKEQRKINQMDKNYLLSAMKDFAGHRTVKQIPDVGNGESGWLLKGMKSPLKHFQVLGASFMRRRELSEGDKPAGGLVADQMGLGKTVMMLANIADDLAYSKKGGRSSTLIVATPALVKQWKDEIYKHLDLSKLGKTPSKPARVILHMTGHKVESSDTENLLASHEFVLTTYDEVRRSFPRSGAPPDFQTAEEKKIWWSKFVKLNQGPLHSVQFKRVVLDEAQAIKNRKSHTSVACRFLTSECRWAMSGTPIQNGTGELYPYFRFLKVPNTGSFRVFKENFIGRNDPDKLDRLQMFLNKILLRRTHNDRLFNQPLVRLPKPSEQVHMVDFNDFERSVYEIVRRRMIQRINHFSREGTLESNYSNILVMLLRLRQLTGHILAIEGTMRDLLELEDHERLKELAEEEAAPNTIPQREAQMIQLRRALAKQHGDDVEDDDEENPGKGKGKGKGRASGRSRTPGGTSRRGDSAGPFAGLNDDPLDSTMGTFDDPLNPDHFESDELMARRLQEEEDFAAGGVAAGHAKKDKKKPALGRSHGLSYDFRVYLDSLRQGDQFEELKTRQTCVICEQAPHDPWTTSCFHVMCLDCLTVLQKSAAELEKEHARCPECGDIFYRCSPLEGWELELQGSEMTEDEGNGEDSDGQKKKKKKKARKNAKAPDWIDLPDHHLLPSSKTMAIKAQILNWLEKDPNQKIIIYTQFLNMIRIMERVCRHEQWGYKKYHGGMTLDERNKSVQEFKDEPQTVVLLASLKCGGVGLNLTMASRVIVIDPWWNRSVEDQAFCRVFRIGQAHETFLTRFAVKKTVDEAMINMQNRKQDEIDEVMNDAKGRRNTKLPIKELIRLFGETREDEHGKAFILVDDKPDCPYLDRDTDDEMFGDEE